MAVVEGMDVDDQQQARTFFGFGPEEPIDRITLRSRRFNKERLARNDEERQLIARYFQLLAAPPAPPAPPAQTIAPEPTPPPAQPTSPAESAAGRQRQVAQMGARVHKEALSLLEDDVIPNTFGLMNRFRADLQQLASLVAGGADFPSEAQRTDLVETLLRVTSESIREALHRGELSLTNGVIRAKNDVLSALGVEVPESHRELHASDYSHNW